MQASRCDQTRKPLEKAVGQLHQMQDTLFSAMVLFLPELSEWYWWCLIPARHVSAFEETIPRSGTMRHHDFACGKSFFKKGDPRKRRPAKNVFILQLVKSWLWFGTRQILQDPQPLLFQNSPCSMVSFPFSVLVFVYYTFWNFPASLGCPILFFQCVSSLYFI